MGTEQSWESSQPMEDDASFLAPPGGVRDWRMVLLHAAAVDAGVLAALPATTNELAARCGVDERTVRVVLEALALWGIVEDASNGAYRLGAGAPAEDAAAVLRFHAAALRQWSAHLGTRLKPSLEGGPPQPEMFLRALAVAARHSAPAVVDATLSRVPHAQRALDLGGGHGEYALEFARRGLQVTRQDRPAMVAVVTRWGHLAAEGVRLLSGDFFETLPEETFDLIFCAGVTDTYGEERNLELYRRLRPRLAEGGRLVLMSFLRGRHAAASLFAVQMALVVAGGDTHAEADYRRWLDQAGFGSVEVIDIEDRRHSLVVAAP
ncbi:MAG: methyltransferase [Candidatus Dormibacteria bacterium]